MIGPTMMPAPGRLTRIGGVFLFLGFSGFGAMFAVFGIQDANIFELMGGGAFILAALGVLFITVDLTRKRAP